MTTKYLYQLYEMKLVTREMTYKWTSRFNNLISKLEKRNK